MYYCDPYADKYQKLQGFEITILEKNNEKIPAYLSFEQSTRSTYDIAMREATIDGLVTMDNISRLRSSQIFYKNLNPTELFIIQAVNKTEQQKKSKNINAIKQNCFVTLLRKQYDEDKEEEIYKILYENIISFVSIQNKDEKNFAAGTEDNTNVSIQIPKKDIIGDFVYDVDNSDRIILEDMNRDVSKQVKIESIDAFGVSGIIKIYGTFETRTGR